MARNPLHTRLTIDALERRDTPALFHIQPIDLDGIFVPDPAASITFASGTVSIKGTHFDDIIRVDNYTPVLTQAFVFGGGDSVLFGDQIVVTVTDSAGNIRNDEFGNPLKQFFSKSAVNLIEAQAFGGNDRIINATDETMVHQGGEGNDTLQGGSGMDILNGENGDDILRGGGGNDQLYGRGGRDRMLGDAGADLMEGGDGNDTMTGGDGNDRMLGESGFDDIAGSNGDDQIFGGDHMDIILGMAGDDILHGDGGGDIIAGNDGRDVLFGDAGNDNLQGGRGNDGLFGGAGRETLNGGRGIDRFLRWDATGNQTTIEDKASNESVTIFKGTTTQTTLTREGLTLRYAPAEWLEDEIEQVDAGLQFLHDEVGNTKLLRRSNGGNMTWIRVGGYIAYNETDGVNDANDLRANQLGNSIAGTNHGNGQVKLNNLTFQNATTQQIAETVIHELAHNWDTENPRYDEWLGLSGWVETDTPNSTQTLSHDGEWVFDSTAEFARNYGKTNPREDFATMFEAYFQLKIGDLPYSELVRLTPKLNFIGLFITSLQ